jgi:hypothetical protein
MEGTQVYIPMEWTQLLLIERLQLLHVAQPYVTSLVACSLLGHCFTHCTALHYLPYSTLLDSTRVSPAPDFFNRTTHCSPIANRMPWTEEGRLTFGLGGGSTSKGITHVFESPTRRAARSSGKGLQSTKGQPRRSYFAIASFSDLRKCVRRRHIPRSTNVVRGNRQ